MRQNRNLPLVVNDGGCSLDAAIVAVLSELNNFYSLKEEQRITKGFSLLSDLSKSLLKHYDISLHCSLFAVSRMNILIDLGKTSM